MADPPRSMRERLLDMWAIALGRPPGYSQGEADDEAPPAPASVWGLLAFGAAVLASAALGGVMGWVIPEPYFHQSVDWMLYGALGAVAVVLLGLAAEAEGLAHGRPAVAGLACGAALGGIGLLLGWSDWDTASTAEVGLLAGMAVAIAPMAGAICFGIGGAVGLADLSYELLRGGIDSVADGLGLMVRGTAVVGLVLIAGVLVIRTRFDA